MKTSNNTLMMIISLICMMTSVACGHDVMEPRANEESIPAKDTIMAVKEDMLASADTSYNFWFSDDIDFQSADPNAYWLMNRMMQTVQHVQTAEDGIAWTLALNENATEYSRRISRRIFEERAEDAALRAIEDLIDIYAAGNQPELNTYSYVTSILEIYRTTNEYIRTMRMHMDEPLANLLYREYREWFEMNNAANGLMTFYTYAAARYSSLPMDINMTFAYWSEERFKEIGIEQDIFWKYNWKPYKAERKTISKRKFKRLIHEFTSLTPGKDEYAYERLDGCFERDRINEMAHLYGEAYCRWLAVRNEIAESLPKQQSKAYREVTRQMNSRLYSDLQELRTIKY